VAWTLTSAASNARPPRGTLRPRLLSAESGPGGAEGPCRAEGGRALSAVRRADCRRHVPERVRPGRPRGLEGLQEGLPEMSERSRRRRKRLRRQAERRLSSELAREGDLELRDRG
jgi:hypothetical protein